MIVDESLASYEAEQAEAEQADGEQAATGRRASDDWSVPDAADGTATEDAAGEPASPSSARDRILIVDDSIYDDDFVLDNGTRPQAEAGSDDVLAGDRDIDLAEEGVSAELPDPQVERHDLAAPDETSATGFAGLASTADDDTIDGIVAVPGPAPTDVGASAETPTAPDSTMTTSLDDTAEADDSGLADLASTSASTDISAETPVASDVTVATGSVAADEASVADLGSAPADVGVSAETPSVPESSDEAAALSQPAALEADDLPVPTYDSLSLPSLRARLRNLDIDQVRMLADYERAHAARADVITMFERRIDKLAAGQ